LDGLFTKNSDLRLSTITQFPESLSANYWHYMK
jgi:hypothetical protein